MTRIDKYWKRSAAGLLAALMLMAGGRGMNFESFAMTSKTPFMEEAALQSPGTLVINDGQAAVQASQDILTPVQIGTDARQAQAAAQTGQGAASRRDSPGDGFWGGLYAGNGFLLPLRGRPPDHVCKP